MPQTLSIEEFDARYGQAQPRTLTLEQFDVREAEPVSEEPSALESFYEGAVKAPARNLYAGYLQSGGGLYDLGANLAMIGNRLGATDREGKPAFRETEVALREMAQELYGESIEYMDDNILAKVYQGLGAAPAAIAELISGTRLLRTATRGFAGVEALHAADKEPEEVALAAARGALTGKTFEAAAPLTRPPRVAALTTIGGAQGAAAGGDVEDVTAGAATLGILGATGGPGQVRLREPRRRPVKPQRQEPTIAPRTATLDTILDLTERVEPATPYTARAIREPGGLPTPPGRAAERGAPFERSQVPVEPEIVDTAGSQPLFRMSIEEVDAILQEKSLSDNQKLLKALGSQERVKRFKQLDRARNSVNIPARADEASRKFDEEFGDLTPEQERLVYGIGETDLQIHEIKVVRTARLNAEAFTDDSPAEIAGEVAFAMRGSEPVKIKQLLERGTGPAETQAALVTIEGGFRELKGRGLANEQIDALILDAMERVGFSRPDAAEVLSKFSKPRARPVRRTPQNFLEFLADNGGVKDETGELKAMDAHLVHHRKYGGKPFQRRLVRDDGLSPDYAREAAAEAGYLPMDTTLGDFYTLIDTNLRGQRTYSDREMTDVADMEGKVEFERQRDQMRDVADEYGISQEEAERLSDWDLSERIGAEIEARSTPETRDTDAEMLDIETERLYQEARDAFAAEPWLERESGFGVTALEPLAGTLPEAPVLFERTTPRSEPGARAAPEAPGRPEDGGAGRAATGEGAAGLTLSEFAAQAKARQRDYIARARADAEITARGELTEYQAKLGPRLRMTLEEGRQRLAELDAMEVAIDERYSEAALRQTYEIQRREGSTTEQTDQGPQTVLPGAERTTGREFVEAQADKRIKGTKAQSSADEGLFDVAGRGQTELSLEEFEQRYSGEAERAAPDAPGAIRRTVRTSAGPAEVIFPDRLHARLFDLTEGKPDKAEVRALYSELEGFVLERFNGPADTISLAREFREEVLEEASAKPGRESHAPLVIDPERQTAYFMQERVGQEAAELYTFPGPISALKKQWHRAADTIIDSLAEGKYSPFARYMGGYPFKDPTMGHLPERTEYLGRRGETQGTIYRTNRVAGRLNDVLRKASVEDQRAALDYLTTEGATPKSLPLAVRGAAVAAKSAIKKVGRELVRRGMLSQEAYDAHADAYLPRVYLKHLMERSGFGAGLKISDQGYLKKRTDLPEEYRNLYLGEIKDVGFLVTKAISQPSRDLAMTDFLRDLSRNPEWVLPESIVDWTAPGMKKPRKVTPYWLKSEAGLLRSRAAAMPDTEQRTRAREIADGMDALADDALGAVKGVPKDFRRMPDSPRYGDLRGLVVRKEIHDDIVGAPGMWVGEKGAYDKTFDKLGNFNAFWKMMKVPFNPPTQIRNMVSNGVLLDLSGVPAQRLPLLYARAFNEIRKNRKYYRIAVKHGIPASTFTAEELYRIRPDLLRVRGEKGGVVGRLAKMGEPLARLAKKPGDLYQFSETWGKVVKIIDAMEREGLSETKAVAAAQEALFDYSLVPNLVRSLRTRAIGAPFITFYYKAFPAVMKGAIKHPGKFAKYLIIPYLLGDALVADLNDVTPEDVDKLRKALPRWLQDQGHVYLYPYRDESGRWAFVNYGYFLPWSMHERSARNAMELATGSYEGSVNDFMSELGVLGGPVPQIGAAMMTGIDPWTGREIIKDTDPPREQIYKLMMYAWRMGGPSWLTDQGVVGHMQRSLSGTPNYYGDPPLSPEQAAGRGVGANIYPVDPVQSRGRNIRRKVFEIREQGRAMRRGLRNRGLNAEQRKELIGQHREQIKRLVEDLREYKKRSEVHPNLRIQRPGGVAADRQ